MKSENFSVSKSLKYSIINSQSYTDIPSQSSTKNNPFTYNPAMLRNSAVLLAKANNGSGSSSNVGKFQKQLNQVQNLLGVAKRRVKNINESFSKEDYLKHRMIERYRTLYLNKQHLKKQANLDKQFASIKEAMEALRNISAEHYELAKNDKNRRFPVEYRVPTDTPPNLIWATEYLKNKQFVEEQEKQ